jgi:hypothetical protein
MTSNSFEVLIDNTLHTTSFQVSISDFLTFFSARNQVLAHVADSFLDLQQKIEALQQRVLVLICNRTLGLKTWQRGFFWEVAPSGCLFGAAILSLSTSTYLARCCSISLSPHSSFFPTLFLPMTSALTLQLLA